MKKIFDENILEEVLTWVEMNLNVVLATVVSTWGSSPRPISSQMIVNSKSNFSGSVSGGCVEINVIRECKKLISEKKLFKKIEFSVSDDEAWEVGLACGGKINIFLEKIDKSKKKLLKKIIEKQKKKKSFAVITNLNDGKSFLFEKNKKVDKKFKKNLKKINLYFSNKKNGIIKNTNIFIKNFNRPTKVIIVGAVHIAQHLINFATNLNFEIILIDPRKTFVLNKKYSGIKIINKWPNKAFDDIEVDKDSALVTLTHDPKIDDLAIQYALNNNFFYIGSLGSKKTHSNRCLRLKKAGFASNKIKKINGPIGFKLGGKTPPEIALSIISQLVYESYKKLKVI
jgi:xanthine dehydrogenase accessory factor|tara:strand:+ start:2714 stop:3736 length:1023 start_codon:yes stop_codon:yes gene_type:complete